jgi:hypothetical protein
MAFAVDGGASCSLILIANGQKYVNEDKRLTHVTNNKRRGAGERASFHEALVAAIRGR